MVSAESPENSIYLLTYRGSQNDFPKLFLPEESSVIEGELKESGICTKPSHLFSVIYRLSNTTSFITYSELSTYS